MHVLRRSVEQAVPFLTFSQSKYKQPVNGGFRPLTGRNPPTRARRTRTVISRYVVTGLPRAETREAIEALLPGNIDNDQVSPF
jgi:hypothetical protein